MSDPKKVTIEFQSQLINKVEKVDFYPKDKFIQVKTKISKIQRFIPIGQMICFIKDRDQRSLNDEEINERQFNDQNVIIVIHVDDLLQQKIRMQQEIYQTNLISKNQNNQQLQVTQLQLNKEKERYENRIKELEDDREKLKQVNQRLQNQIVDLQLQSQELLNQQTQQLYDENDQFRQKLFEKQKALLDENNKLNKQLQNDKNALSDLKNKFDDQSNQNRLLQEKLKRFEDNNRNPQYGPQNDFELKRLKDELDYEQNQKANLQVQLKRLQQQIQKLQEECNKFQVVKLSLDNKLTEETRNHFNEKEQFRNKISAFESEIENYKMELQKCIKIIEQNKQTAVSQEAQQNKILQELKELRIQEADNEGRIRSQATEITILKTEVESLRKGNTNNKDLIEKQSKEFQDKLKKELDQQLQFQNEKNQLSDQLRQTQEQLGKQIEEYQKLEINLKQTIESSKKIEEIYKQDLKKANYEKNLFENQKDKLVIRIKRNYGKTNTQVTSPFVILFRENKDPNEYLNGDNASTQDQIFQARKIIPDERQLEKNIFNISDMDFSEAFKLGNAEQWDCLKSIQTNGEGSHTRVTILQIQKTNRYFAIKDTNKFLCDENIESLYQFIFPTLIAQYMLKQFNNVQKEPNLFQFKFQDQYVLQTGTKYYYAIAIEKSDSSIIKQNGKQFIGVNKQIQQLINAFQMFSYYKSQKQLIIDNLQCTQNIFYDPIIHTNDGLFNDEDQGETRILDILSEAQNNRDIYGSVYLNKLNIQL